MFIEHHGGHITIVRSVRWSVDVCGFLPLRRTEAPWVVGLRSWTMAIRTFQLQSLLAFARPQQPIFHVDRMIKGDPARVTRSHRRKLRMLVRKAQHRLLKM